MIISSNEESHADNTDDEADIGLPMNRIPVANTHPRPSRHVFVFGNGEMGQLGMGVDVLREFSRPTIHTWFEDARESCILGDSDGASVEQICAGGMHSLVIDESGRVRANHFRNSWSLTHFLCL